MNAQPKILAMPERNARELTLTVGETKLVLALREILTEQVLQQMGPGAWGLGPGKGNGQNADVLLAQSGQNIQSLAQAVGCSRDTIQRLFSGRFVGGARVRAKLGKIEQLVPGLGHALGARAKRANGVASSR